MRRRAFHLLTGASFLLFLATLALWVRSYIAMDNVVRYTLEQRGKYWVARSYSLYSAKGVLLLRRSGWLATYEKYPWDSSTEKLLWVELPADDVQMESKTLLQRLGFGRQWIVSRVTGKVVSWDVMLPHWALAAFFAVVPLWWLWKRIFRKKTARGFEISTQPAD